MKPLVKLNLNAIGQIGWCLAYGENLFRTPHLYNTAWEAWTKTRFKHTDPHMPNAPVPVWFSYFSGGVNYGHVVGWVPGKGFFSSPWQRGTTHAVLGTIAQIERIYGVKYVGWSEDIAGVRVAAPIPKPAPVAPKPIAVPAPVPPIVPSPTPEAPPATPPTPVVEPIIPAGQGSAPHISWFSSLLSLISKLFKKGENK